MDELDKNLGRLQAAVEKRIAGASRSESTAANTATTGADYEVTPARASFFSKLLGRFLKPKAA